VIPFWGWNNDTSDARDAGMQGCSETGKRAAERRKSSSRGNRTAIGNMLLRMHPKF
jgi:hypothetical protein